MTPAHGAVGGHPQSSPRAYVPANPNGIAAMQPYATVEASDDNGNALFIACEPTGDANARYRAMCEANAIPNGYRYLTIRSVRMDPCGTGWV